MTVTLVESERILKADGLTWKKGIDGGSLQLIREE